MKPIPTACLLPLLLAGAVLPASAQTASSGSGQAWPSRPIRLIVATSPPGGADVVARTIAPGLSERLGQQVVVENRAGASTMIGHEFVAKSAPDGYTFAMGISTLAINPATFKKVPYDALRDFAPIMQAVKQALLLVVHPSFPAKSVKELIAIAKQQPGVINYASPGFGTNPQMGMELFLYMGGQFRAKAAKRRYTDTQYRRHESGTHVAAWLRYNRPTFGGLLQSGAGVARFIVVCAGFVAVGVK